MSDKTWIVTVTLAVPAPADRFIDPLSDELDAHDWTVAQVAPNRLRITGYREHVGPIGAASHVHGTVLEALRVQGLAGEVVEAGVVLEKERNLKTTRLVELARHAFDVGRS